MLPRALLLSVSVVALADASHARSPEAVAAAVERGLAWAGTETPGCAVAVERDGVRLATAARGSADLEHDVPITAETVFEAGSVAKQFTAAAIVLLAKDGRLSLDDDVRRWFSELPDYGRVITVRMLLDHTSGLRDWGSLYDLAGWPRTTRVYTQADALDMIARQTALNYAPGTEWSYTNSGYNLAALLVERAGGETLAAFTRRRLFEPLGMARTGWRDDFRAVVEDRATAYRKTAGAKYEQLMPFEDAHGNGGLLTTVGDLLTWNRALEENRFGLGEALGTGTRLNDGTPTRYGLGLFLADDRGRTEISHGGATAGYRAFLGRWPAMRTVDASVSAGGPVPSVSVAALCNTANADAGALARAAVGPVLDRMPPSAAPEAALRRGDATLAGVYADAATGMPRTLVATPEGGLATGDGRPVSAVRESGGRVRVGGTDAGGRSDRAFDWSSGQVWRRVDPASTTVDPAMVGLWRSEEIGAEFRIAAGAGGALAVTIERRPGSETTYRPVYRDAWQAGGALIRAVRDERGRITAVSLGEPRVRDLRLERAR